MENDKKFAYGVIILGTLLAGAISIVPHYGAGYRLAFASFLWSLVPYYAYLLLSGVASGMRLVLPGVLMIMFDIIAKAYRAVHRESTLGEALDLYLPIVLLITLVAGYGIGARRDKRDVSG
jgi:hypothetical protein